MSAEGAAFDRSRRLIAEALGTGFLLAAVVGSGIMAERLAGGNAALALLGNTLPTGAIPMVLILIFGPVSGAHLNAAVTFSFLLQRQLSAADALAFVLAQLGGTWLAHAMFGQPVLMLGTTARAGAGQ